MDLITDYSFKQGEICKLPPNSQSRGRSGEKQDCDSTNKNISPIKESSGEYITDNLPPLVQSSSNVLRPYYLSNEYESKLRSMAEAFGCEEIDILHQAITLYDKVSLSKGKLVLNTNGLKEKISFPYMGDKY